MAASIADCRRSSTIGAVVISAGVLWAWMLGSAVGRPLLLAFLPGRVLGLLDGILVVKTL